MAVDQRVSIFTQAMRTEFVNSYAALEAKIAPWEKFTEIIPSTARIEHYPWIAPTPGMAQYAGHRRFGKLDTVKYSVENKEFDSSFQVLLRDIEDDQVGGYMKKPAEMAGEARDFPGEWVLAHLAAGGSRACFDGTNFFADSHSIGTGDNNLTKNCASNDGASLKLIALYHGGPLKPLLWQSRKPPRLNDNAGSKESERAKMIDYWVDMEGEAAYGYWWDAVLVTITDTPNIEEMGELFNQIEVAFRSFAKPKAHGTDSTKYPHEQTVFSESNLHVIGSASLSGLLRQALGQDLVPQAPTANNSVATTNLWKGWASYSISNRL